MKRKESNFLEYITWSELEKLKLRPEKLYSYSEFCSFPSFAPAWAGVTAPRSYDVFLLMGKNEEMKYYLLL